MKRKINITGRFPENSRRSRDRRTSGLKQKKKKEEIKIDKIFSCSFSCSSDNFRCQKNCSPIFSLKCARFVTASHYMAEQQNLTPEKFCFRTSCNGIK